MKNLRISMKLTVGFGIVLLLMLLSVTLSIYSINIIGQQVELYGKHTVPNANSTWSMRRDLVSVQRYILRAITAAESGNSIQTQNYIDKAKKDAQSILDTLDIYAANQRNHDNDEQIQKMKTQLDQAASIRADISQLILDGSDDNINKALDIFDQDYVPAFDQVATILIDFNDKEGQLAGQKATAAENASALAWSLLIGCVIFSVILSLVIIMIIRKSILSPVNEIVRVYKELAKGNMHEEVKYESRDELGEMARLIKKTNDMQGTILGDIIEKFKRISEGDIRIKVDLDYPGDYEVLKYTIQNTAEILNGTLQAINIAAEQVSTGAIQVSSGAQILATGSTEQAASVEELSASMMFVAEQAEQNSNNVKVATQYVEQAATGVNIGDKQMRQLTQAMADIGDSSKKISNITKVIEDIAFQTNILALNAAIEAARAGNAGKGFAVVADEVRSLAAKSADAAKQTSELIQNSAVTVAEGIQLTTQTAQILMDISEKTNLVNKIISNINQASSEQVVAIEQIQQGISQVSAVIQTNAATAEENSATSEEMSAQAVTLRDEVGKFKLASEYKIDTYKSVRALSPHRAAIALGYSE